MTFGSWNYPTNRIEFKTHPEAGHSLFTGHLYCNNVEWFIYDDKFLILQ